MDTKAALKDYKGKHPYLLVLKGIIEEGKELNFAQESFAKKLLITNAIKHKDRTLIPLPTIKDFKIDWEQYSNKPPYNFQKLGINWLMNKERAILGDEMGTGKSLQSIIAAIELGISRILVICPNTLKLNWKREIESLDKGASITIYDKGCNLNAKWIIVNYDKIYKIEDDLKKFKPELLIGDEAHYVKSGRKAKRAACFQRVANKTKRVWLLTGTPISNRPIDFYQLLKICKHELGKSKEVYGMKYCGGEKTQWGTDYNGASNLKDLYFRTQDVILRRLKTQVLDLPEKQLVPLYLQLRNPKDYIKAASDKFQEIYDNIDNEESEHYGKDLGNGAAFIEMSAYRVFCALEKIKDGTLIDLIETIVDSGEKVVIFTNFTAVIDTIKKEFGDECVVLDGRVSLEDRQKNIDAFQTGKPSICACNYKVGSVGTTLTRAAYEVMNDLPWDPATLKQAEDRVHRIGQDKKTTIYFPVYQDTIDSIMFTVLTQKSRDLHEAIDGDEDIVKYKKMDSTFNEIYNQVKKKRI